MIFITITQQFNYDYDYWYVIVCLVKRPVKWQYLSINMHCTVYILVFSSSAVRIDMLETTPWTQHFQKHFMVKQARVEKITIFFNKKCLDIYIDVFIDKLFQTCSIQIDLGTCLNRGYMIFAYIKTLGNVHKASPLVAA